ncbi:TMhelix containing protein [Vibrio phage 2.275.O._10N.286.54.E11]|nr:TMhelix containing protein [Vibrio phage 2.275.O._10N.286.54.E11]
MIDIIVDHLTSQLPLMLIMIPFALLLGWVMKEFDDVEGEHYESLERDYEMLAYLDKNKPKDGK